MRALRIRVARWLFREAFDSLEALWPADKAWLRAQGHYVPWGPAEREAQIRSVARARQLAD